MFHGQHCGQFKRLVKLSLSLYGGFPSLSCFAENPYWTGRDKQARKRPAFSHFAADDRKYQWGDWHVLELGIFRSQSIQQHCTVLCDSLHQSSTCRYWDGQKHGIYLISYTCACSLLEGDKKIWRSIIIHTLSFSLPSKCNWEKKRRKCLY